MSTALDAIRKQAEAIKNNNNAAKAAELLRQAAALLEAGTPKTGNFAKEFREGIREARKKKMESFSAAMKSNFIEKRDQMMKGYGLVLVNTFADSRVYGFQDEAGKMTLFRLKIEDGKFTVWRAGGAVRKAPAKIEELEAYLHSDFKKHVKQ